MNQPRVLVGVMLSRAVLFESGITVAQDRCRRARYLAQTLDGADAEAVQLGSRIRLLIGDMRAQERRARRVNLPHPTAA